MTTPTVSTRRSFIQIAGAAVAATATSVPVRAATEADPLEMRLAYLEDVNAIRALNQEYARHVNAGARAPMAALFADPTEAPINPDVTGVTPDGFGEHDVIDVAPDRRTATALLHCTVHVQTAIGPDCPLVEMARAQGGGIVRQTEHGVFDNAYVRRDGVWKIARSGYRLLSARARPA
jgi:hypothetical protein